MYGSVEVVVAEGADSKSLKIFDAVTVIQEPPIVVIEVMIIWKEILGFYKCFVF